MEQIRLQQATFKNNKTGETWQYQAPDNDTFGVFVFAGYQPATSLFQDQVELNETGNLIVDENQKLLVLVYTELVTYVSKT
ncbi:hypothetical protein SD457_04305 [Coprobacillaceae bacterium CR2/5/TPMF4]|nr:hypothetical protein SD457_04305 [Coprobacillaceae bacterium CR2/5/TPMF4]